MIVHHGCDTSTGGYNERLGVGECAIDDGNVIHRPLHPTTDRDAAPLVFHRNNNFIIIIVIIILLELCDK